jgi:hypothetical protein
VKRLKSNKKNLPAKLSDLLEVALDNLRDFTGRGHKVAMDHWLTGDRGSACVGCLAGATLFCELGVRPGVGEFLRPDCLDGIIGQENVGRLRAINDMRIGNFFSAALSVDLVVNEATHQILRKIGKPIKSAYNDPIGRAPIREYRKAVKQLRAVNL